MPFSLHLIALRTLHSLFLRASVRVVMLSVLAGVLATGLWMLGVAALVHALLDGLLGWAKYVTDWAASGLAVLGAWFLYPLILPAVGSLFCESLMRRIAREEYELELREVPLRAELLQTLGFAALALLANLMLLPFYLVPLLGQVLYYIVNGYLLGREFWQMACARLHLHAYTLRWRRVTLIGAGVMLVLCANVPLLNLLMPLYACAFMLHLGALAMQRGAVESRSTPLKTTDSLPPERKAPAPSAQPPQTTIVGGWR